MVEYGNGISQGAGQVSGSHGGGGGGNVDLGAQLGSWVSSAQHTVSTMPASGCSRAQTMPAMIADVTCRPVAFW
jgi:hypothetical protein